MSGPHGSVRRKEVTLLVPGPGASHRDGRGILTACVLIVVLGQRFALPLGGGQQVPATTLLLLAVFLVGLRRAALVLDRSRTLLFGIALAVLALVTVAAEFRGQQPSMLSLLLILLIYLPATAVAASRAASLVALRRFVDLMLVLAASGLALFGLQYAGLAYRDYLAAVVPSAFVQQGYVTSYPLSYGSDIYRSNGVVFLEASFFSLFLGLALVVSLYLSHRTRYLSVLAAALVSTASGNGLVFVAASLLVGAVLGPRRGTWRALAVPVVLAAVVVLLTPLGSVLASRSTEVSSPDSSASLRMVRPYQILVPAYTSSAPSLLAGNGAGSVQDYYEATVLDANKLPSVLAPAVPKLFYEYGATGALPFLTFLLWTFLRAGLRVPWWPGVLLAYFVVNAGLQQATIAAMAYLFLSVLPGARPDVGGERRLDVRPRDRRAEV